MSFLPPSPPVRAPDHRRFRPPSFALLLVFVGACSTHFDGCNLNDCEGDADCPAGSICDLNGTLSLGTSCFVPTSCTSDDDCPWGSCEPREAELADNPFERDKPNGELLCTCGACEEDGSGGQGGGS
jgi:hypothetical protein